MRSRDLINDLEQVLLLNDPRWHEDATGQIGLDYVVFWVTIDDKERQVTLNRGRLIEWMDTVMFPDVKGQPRQQPDATPDKELSTKEMLMEALAMGDFSRSREIVRGLLLADPDDPSSYGAGTVERTLNALEGTADSPKEEKTSEAARVVFNDGINRVESIKVPGGTLFITSIYNAAGDLQDVSTCCMKD